MKGPAADFSDSQTFLKFLVAETLKIIREVIILINFIVPKCGNIRILKPFAIFHVRTIEMIRSRGPLFGPFWDAFSLKIVLFFVLFFDWFSGCLFYGFFMILGLFFRGFLSVFLDVFWNCELVNMCTPLERQLDFQGSAGFGSVRFVLFFGVRFPDGFGNGFLMVLGWIWAPF